MTKRLFYCIMESREVCEIMEYTNRKGFTLVELLAVIVVLAIVMLIALQAVMPRMEEARKSVLAIEANSAIKSAQTYFTNQSLKSNTSGFPSVIGKTNCVTIEALIDGGYSELSKTSYSGKVLIKKETDTYYTYLIYLQKDKTLMIVAKGSKDGYNVNIDGDDVDGYQNWQDSYSTCSSAESGGQTEMLMK